MHQQWLLILFSNKRAGFNTFRCSTKFCSGKLEVFPNNNALEVNEHNHSKILNSEISLLSRKQNIKEISKSTSLQTKRSILYEDKST